MKKRHIYLTGFMGAGKSRIGRHLADLLNLPFVDTDQEIEKIVGKTVRQIFEEEGEAFFRKQEAEIVRQVSQHPAPRVVALGGGALNNSRSLENIHRSGIVIYLKSAPEAIFKRVAHSRKRPLLDVDEAPDREAILIKRIEDLLQKRERLYLKADIIIDRDGLEAEQVAEHLLFQIELYRKEHHGKN
ncbi:shikimate kinase [Calditrichota bacterium GD2]